MIKVCYQEFKRFKPIIYITFPTLLLYMIFSGSSKDVQTYIQMDFIIKVTTVLSMMIVAIFIMMDSYNQNQSMYQKVSVTEKDVIYGKWLTISFIGLITLLYGILLINIKASFYIFSDRLGFLTSDIESLQFILWSKLWFEWLYIINYLVNLMILSFMVIFINLRIKDIILYGNPYDFKYSIPWMVFKVILVQVIMRFILVWIEPTFFFFNFNSRGEYLIIREQPQMLFINFLFIPSILFYLVYFMIVKYSINNITEKR
ncbi:MAG: hypothetical protein KKH92_05300 [Firmicutes bacterium]|nr:hypothetical protein [Bacillota bacterium]